MHDLDLAFQNLPRKQFTTKIENLADRELRSTQEQETGLAHILDQAGVLFGQTGQGQRIVLNGQDPLSGDRNPFRSTKLGEILYVGL